MKVRLFIGLVAGLIIAVAVVQAMQPSTQPSGEIYVAGAVARPGVYAITDPLDVLAAVKLAGVENAAADYTVTIVHVIVPKRLEKVTRFNSLKALQEVPAEAIALEAGDHVILEVMKR